MYIITACVRVQVPLPADVQAGETVVLEVRLKFGRGNDNPARWYRVSAGVGPAGATYESFAEHLSWLGRSFLRWRWQLRC